jgi:hypothetical protein
MAKRTTIKPTTAKRTPAKPKAQRRTRSTAAEATSLSALFDAAPPLEDVPIATDDASLHDLFQRQTLEMLDRSDLSEEQKQSILVAMNCPCCGGSGLSFTMKLKRKR